MSFFYYIGICENRPTQNLIRNVQYPDGGTNPGRPEQKSQMRTARPLRLALQVFTSIVHQHQQWVTFRVQQFP